MITDFVFIYLNFQLLNDEICKERNYIFQTCRYIVQNNFFDKPKPAPPSAEVPDLDNPAPSAPPEGPEEENQP